MIIFRDAHDKLAAIHVAQAFDRNDLIVVAMAFDPSSSSWLIVGQGESADISQIDKDIKALELGPRSIIEDLDEIDRIIAEAESGEEDDIRHGQEPTKQ